jgi:hypothetical protein
MNYFLGTALAGALFFFTFAEGLHNRRRVLRYTLASLGIVTLIITIVIAFRTLVGGV